MGPEVLGFVAIAVIAGLVLLLLVTLKPHVRALVFDWLVGITGGLMAVQVASVHAFTIVVVLWALFSRRVSKSIVPWEAAAIFVSSALVASTVLYGSLVNSQTIGLQLIAFAICAGIIVAYAREDSIPRILSALLFVISVSSFWALLQVAGIAPKDAWHLDVSALGRPTGIYPEPDWLGMFAAVGVVLAWSLKMRTSLRVFLIILNIAAWVLAFARAAWVALAIAAVVAIVVRLFQVRRSGEKTRGRGAAVGLVAAVGFLAFELIPPLQADVINRLERTFSVQVDDISAQARVNQNESLLELMRSAPWYGWGLSASGRVRVFGGIHTGETTGRNNVASNWLFGMWADAALLAIPLLAVLVVAIVATLNTTQSIALLTVLVSSLFSNAFFQPVTWLLIGLCLAEMRRRREARVSSLSGSRLLLVSANRDGSRAQKSSG